MSFLKKAAALVLCLALCGSMFGCESMELYERLLIHGIGIDVSGDCYIVTVRSSVSAQDEGEEYFKSEGKSVLEALNNLSLSTGREPFYSHNYLVVFGRECAELGLDRCMDFFVRYYNTRPAVKMFLAEDTAEEILSAQKEEKFLKMSEIQQLAESNRYNGKSMDVDILTFVNGVKREGSSPCLPVLRATDSGVEVSATAIFEDYRLKDSLTLDQTRGLLAMTERIEKGEAVVKGTEFGEATLSISTRSGQVDVSLDEAGTPVFHIKIEAKGDISAISGGRNRMQDEYYPAIEEALSRELQKQVQSALKQGIQEAQCDVFGFGNLLYRTYPEYWRTVADDWQDNMLDCRFEIEVASKVLRLEEEDEPLM